MGDALASRMQPRRHDMHWRIKGTIQRMLGHIPAGRHVHYALQKSVGGLTNFQKECAAKIEDWELMAGHLRSSGLAIPGAVFVEIGTGWYPTFPLCLHLAGAARVHTLDLNRHLKPAMTRQLVAQLATCLARIAEASASDLAVVAADYWSLCETLGRGSSLATATGLRVDYRAPADAAHTGLPGSSADVVFSNSVLEHVQPKTIRAIFGESLRVLRPGGVMFHSVNCGDHYAYVDASIHQLNYLRFSDEEWRWWNNEFLYQNRLRACDFVDMATDAGFTVELDTSRPSKERLAQLARTPVHSTFARYSPEQLAATSIDFIARKPCTTSIYVSPTIDTLHRNSVPIPSVDAPALGSEGPSAR